MAYWVRVFLVGACMMAMGCGNSNTPSDSTDVVQDVPPNDVPDTTVPDVPPTDESTPDTEPEVVTPSGCTDDNDCTLTQYDALVTDTEECFEISDACPVCPNWAVTKSVQAEREAAWAEYCTEWVEENPCPDPGCSSPGIPICVDGACTLNHAQPVKCDANVTCDVGPPQCQKPMIPINKDGCWGCAYEATCTCSDGSPVLGATKAPNCPTILELAAQVGTFHCVDPLTCIPQGNISDEPCSTGEECVISEYSLLVTGPDDCNCVECPWFPTSVAEHEKRKGAWDTHCADLSLDCVEPVDCVPPGQAACIEGKCGVDVTPPTTLCDEGASLVCGDELGEDPNTLYDCNENDPVLEEVCEFGCKAGTAEISATCEPSACSANITCDDPEPFCVPPMVLANKDGCWGCAFEKTCSCSHTDVADCKLPPPECPEDLELAIQDPGNGISCYACVNPITCEPVNPCDDGASLVCGDALGKDPNTLYDCNENAPILEEVCEFGCKAGAGDESATCETSACSADITCDDPEPFCVEPLVIANKNGCWGCGYAATCSCSHVEVAICKLPKPDCAENLELAIQDPGNGIPCYVCVDPITCETL